MSLIMGSSAITGLLQQDEMVCADLPAEDTSDYLQHQEIKNLSPGKQVGNALCVVEVPARYSMPFYSHQVLSPPLAGPASP